MQATKNLDRNQPLTWGTLPPLAFDDVNLTIGALAKQIRKELSQRVTHIHTGATNLCYNRADLMNRIVITAARLNATSLEKRQKIIQEAKEFYQNYKQLSEVNSSLIQEIETTIIYMKEAARFFTETKTDNMQTISAARKTEIEKRAAQERVAVCDRIIEFLGEKSSSTKAMHGKVDHDRNGAKGELAQLENFKTLFTPKQGWGQYLFGQKSATNPSKEVEVSPPKTTIQSTAPAEEVRVISAEGAETAQKALITALDTIASVAAEPRITAEVANTSQASAPLSVINEEPVKDSLYKDVITQLGATSLKTTPKNKGTPAGPKQPAAMKR